MKNKTRYRFHPAEYAVAETERFYAEQAAKGWLLESRGQRLSKFKRGEAQKLRYRMEFASPGFLEDPGLPDEQIALYEECGWELAGACGRVHLFRTAEDNAVPELYTSPEEQAAALKGLRRSYRSGLIAVLVLLAAVALWRMLTGSAGEWGAELAVRVVRTSPIIFSYPLFLLWATWDLVVGDLRTAALCRRLKRGIPIDRTPRVRHRVFRVISRSLVILAVVCLLGAIVQLAALKKPEFPGEPGGPYLLLCELGLEGEPGKSPLGGETSGIENFRTPFAEVWDVTEHLQTEEGLTILYQDVYRMASPAAALRFAPAVVEDAALADLERFRAVTVDGLDGAWESPHGCVAVKGEYIWYTTEIHFWDREVRLDILETLAQKTEP